MPPTETRAFAHRVRLNLDAIDAVVSVAPAKAHQVTQLVLTLIGLIVLPRESHYLEAAGDSTLPALAAAGLADVDDRARSVAAAGRRRRYPRRSPVAPAIDHQLPARSA